MSVPRVSRVPRLRTPCYHPPVGCAGLNLQELLVILFVVVLVMGAGRLPQLGDALGRSIRNFKRALRGDNEIDVTPKGPRQVPGPDRDDPRGGA